MGSETIQTLPTIDFSLQKLEPGSHAWDILRTQVREAAERYGCFQAVYSSKLSPNLQRDLLSAIKQLNFVTVPEQAFYYRFVVDDAHCKPNLERFADTMWPEGNQFFCDTVNSVANLLVELEETIRRMCIESLGIQNHLDFDSKNINYHTRFHYYSPLSPQYKESQVGLIPHNDINVITILCNDDVPGLEVMTEDLQWIPIATSPHAFIVLVGETFRVWSNNIFKSPRHRVMINSGKGRFTCGFFSIPRREMVIKTPEELIDEDHPQAFKPYVYKDYSAFIRTTEGMSSHEPLNLFAGI